MSDLEYELDRFDFKFGPGAQQGYSNVEFYVRYCSPQEVRMPGEGIIPLIQILKPIPALQGKEQIIGMSKLQPRTPEGLERARAGARELVEKVLGMTLRADVIEMATWPDAGTVDYSALYRIPRETFNRLIIEKKREQNENRRMSN